MAVAFGETFEALVAGLQGASGRSAACRRAAQRQSVGGDPRAESTVAGAI